MPLLLFLSKNTFSSYSIQNRLHDDYILCREDALNLLLNLTGDSAIVSTTGKTSRELFELRVKRNENQRDFLTVGGMGHASSIALGAALGCPDKEVVCIDGDGAVLMHLGSLPIIGSLSYILRS